MKKTKAEIEQIIQSMSPAQKAGQLFLLAYPGKDPEVIRPLVGAIWNLWMLYQPGQCPDLR